MKFPVLNIDGSKAETIEISDKIVKLKVNHKLIKFVTMTFLGVIVNRLLSILKDPAQLLDPIKQFFNVFIGMFNAVMKGLWMITGAPINFVISTINKGVKGIIDGINSVSGLLALPKLDAPEIPLIPGPPQVPMIPLSKTAQEKNEEANVLDIEYNDIIKRMRVELVNKKEYLRAV